MTKRPFLAAACIVTALSLFFSPAFAAYSWVDDNGEFHITDYPKPVKREEPKDLSESGVPASPARSEVKSIPVQTPPIAPQTAPAPVSTGTKTITPFAPVSAGTTTQKPTATVSLLTPTSGGNTIMATAATVSLLTTTTTPTVPLPVALGQPQTALLPNASQQMPAAGIMAFVMAFFMIIVVLFIGIYIYFSLCLFLIAKKLNVSAPWIAWVPIVQIWTLLQAAGKPCWWVVLFFIPVIGIIASVYVWMCIAENLGRNKWLGLLILAPFINLVYIGVLAFSKQEQQAEMHDQADPIGQEWKPSQDSSEEHK